VTTEFVAAFEGTVDAFARSAGATAGVSNLMVVMRPPQGRKEVAALKSFTSPLFQGSVTNLVSQQAQIRAEKTQTVTGINPQALMAPGVSSRSDLPVRVSVPIGPAFDFTLFPSTNDSSWEISLDAIATIKAVRGTGSGYGGDGGFGGGYGGVIKPTDSVGVYVNGVKQSTTDLTHYETFQLPIHALVPDGCTVVCCKPVDEHGEPARLPGMPRQTLLVFTTLRLMNSAGSPLHTDQEIEEYLSKSR
jgi:hypothetical protein